MTISEDARRRAVNHLKKSDATLKEIIERVGPFELKLRRHRFRTLVRSIISQQISVAAARTILKRLHDLVGGSPTPETLAALEEQAYRSAGVSRQKASYLIDLAEKTRDGVLRFRHYRRMDNEAVIEDLVQVKGVGRWTAQMLLIFSLGRLDVFPADDLGIRNAIRQSYELAEMPDRETANRLAAPWRPYASVASWYLWRSLE